VQHAGRQASLAAGWSRLTLLLLHRWVQPSLLLNQQQQQQQR
jgi:hypothetical protein